MMCWFAWWEVAVENGKKSKIRDVPEAAGRRRGVRASTSRGNKVCVDLDALLAGHCRQAVTLLPRGVLGVATAIEFLGALPGACRLGLPDVTDSGPKLFALLVAHGVLAAMPSPRVVPAALALIAGVSPVLQARSARQWTLWLGQVREPSSAMTGALREQTPMSQISLAPPSTTAHPLRTAALRADRDRLGAELALATDALARARGHADQEAARAAALQRQLEQSAATRSGKDLREEFKKVVAAARTLLGVADDDPRNFGELIFATVNALKEQTARADDAQQGLHRVLADLAVADEKIAALQAKLGDRRRDQLEAHAQVEALEIELGEANAELDLRRSRMLRPEARDVEQYRAAGAADARRAQQRRKTSSRL
jgi:hypothetical protein